MSAEPNVDGRMPRLLRGGAIAIFIGTLLWVPFPLGGAIRWAPSVQQFLVAAAWVLWILGTIQTPVIDRRHFRLIIVPAALFGSALVWAMIQICPWVPREWIHPVWTMASDTLRTTIPGVISVNPWRTEAEILNLASYVLAGGLVFAMARRIETAKLLLNAVILIGTIYALYAFALASSGVQQINVLYTVPYKSALISGPFMLHNSFATYCGLAALAATGKLFDDGSKAIVAGRGVRRLAETTLQYCLGRGALTFIALIVNFSAVVASASRAGFVATMAGLFALALVALAMTRGRANRVWAGVGALIAATPIIVILIINGDTLASRIDQLLASDTADAIRFSLWASARRMIWDAPLLGLGLGTFEDAYPLYATEIYPFVMDKAHCDYLEFAAGIGLPAAILWWTALLWLCGANLRAIFVRHRNRMFSAIALGAAFLVGVHSTVDFSLQLPAVALSFAAILALGSAQCLRTIRN